MSSASQYNLEAKGGLGVILSEAAIQNLESDANVRSALSKAKDFGYLGVRPMHAKEGPFRYSFNIAKIGGKRDLMNRDVGLKIVTNAIAGISNSMDAKPFGDPLMDVMIGTEPTDNRLPMSAELQWPKIISAKKANERDFVLSNFATNAMRVTAKSLKYAKQEIGRRGYNDLVYAHVAKKTGITLETNPLGSCSLDTDGMSYKPSDERFVIMAHNLYSPEQQLICLAGAIAIAHADEILAVTT